MCCCGFLINHSLRQDSRDLLKGAKKEKSNKPDIHRCSSAGTISAELKCTDMGYQKHTNIPNISTNKLMCYKNHRCAKERMCII